MLSSFQAKKTPGLLPGRPVGEEHVVEVALIKALV
jgi:hypothetical protein